MCGALCAPALFSHDQQPPPIQFKPPPPSSARPTQAQPKPNKQKGADAKAARTCCASCIAKKMTAPHPAASSTQCCSATALGGVGAVPGGDPQAVPMPWWGWVDGGGVDGECVNE